MPGKQENRLDQELRLSQRLSQQQVRYVRMLEMTDAEVAQDVRRELDENPALETADPVQPSAPAADDKSVMQFFPVSAPLSATTSRQEFFQPAAEQDSLYDYLNRQLLTMELTPDVALAAKYLVGNIDANGYLRRATAAVATDILLTEDREPSEQDMQRALQVVQSLDPPGVGAGSLEECMRLQLYRMPPSQSRNDALKIIERRFDDLAHRRLTKLLSATGADRRRLEEALALLRRLNPKPGAPFADHETPSYISPDFFIDVERDDIRVSLAMNVPELALSASFSKAVAEMERRRDAGRDKYIMQRYADAREYMRILERRQQTMMDVMTAIVKLQKPYFLSRGDDSLLRPMGLRDVSRITALDVSVISRVSKNKYVSMPWGMVPVRHFFSESFSSRHNTDSENVADTPSPHTDTVSGRGVESAIRAVVDNEDKRHPLSDEAICSLLRKKGFDVSRRTVSKYRDRLNIPVARLRVESL